MASAASVTGTDVLLFRSCAKMQRDSAPYQNVSHSTPSSTGLPSKLSASDSPSASSVSSRSTSFVAQFALWQITSGDGRVHAPSAATASARLQTARIVHPHEQAETERVVQIAIAR